MPFDPLPAPRSTARTSLLLCVLLCAGCAHINLSQAAPPCRKIVEASGLLSPTPGASLPANDTVGEIAAFGVREAGQLDVANADKASAGRILASCDDEWLKALKGARPRRFLGLL